MSNKISVRTRVRLTIEIDGGAYGADWKIQDLHNQAGREAAQMVRNAFRQDGVKLIGEPVVVLNTMEPSNG